MPARRHGGRGGQHLRVSLVRGPAGQSSAYKTPFITQKGDMAMGNPGLTGRTVAATVASTQAQVGERIGWSRTRVADYARLQDVIVAQVLDLARSIQEGRATETVANETFPFTEGWFRNSGMPSPHEARGRGGQHL